MAGIVRHDSAADQKKHRKPTAVTEADVSWKELLYFGNRYSGEAGERRSEKTKRISIEKSSKAVQPLKNAEPEHP
jgi:hypothetical protein